MQQFEKIICRGNTTVLIGRSTIGLYEMEDGGVIIIDTGTEEDYLQLNAYLEEHHLSPLMILNTHSHADHMFGNEALRRRYGICAYASQGEVHAAAEPQRLFERMCGASPSPHMMEFLLHCVPAKLNDISRLAVPDGFQICSVPGHSCGDIAVRTPDGIWFLGDSLLCMHALERCKLSFVTSFKEYVNSLRIIAELKGVLFVPGHGQPEEDGRMLAEKNLGCLENLTKLLTEYCATPHSLEDLISFIMQHEGNSQLSRYLSLRTSLMSFLYCMEETGVFRFFVDGGYLLWQKNCV